MSGAFKLEVLVDIPDDCTTALSSLGKKEIDSLMAKLREFGVERVIWTSYADGFGGWMFPKRSPDALWSNFDRYRHLLDTVANPLQSAVTAAHRHGLEIYACFKPYETGIGIAFPEGCPEVLQYPGLRTHTGQLVIMDRFVYEHPECRVRHRGHLSSDVDAMPIRTLELTKSDDLPTRITGEHLQIWESDDNWSYRQVHSPILVTQAIRSSACDITDVEGRVLTQRGDPVRVLTVEGLDLRARYIAVTTDFNEGPPDFGNIGVRILSALSADGEAIPGIIGTAIQIWGSEPRDFRRNGLPFDEGWNAATVFLDAPTGPNNQGVVGFERGRNPTLPLALCETEPMVQDFWLRCLDEITKTGVSGVDFRISSHCTHTDFPDEYGYNRSVLKLCREAGLQAVPENIARIRGQAYTGFLRRSQTLLAERGCTMRVSLHQDGFRGFLSEDRHIKRRLAYPGLILFNWQQWLEEQLFDEATLRSYALPFSALEEDSISKEMIDRCMGHDVPIYVQRYLNPGHREPLSMPQMYERTRRDKRFTGFCLYELQSFLQLNEDGLWQFRSQNLEEQVTEVFQMHRRSLR